MTASKTISFLTISAITLLYHASGEAQEETINISNSQTVQKTVNQESRIKNEEDNASFITNVIGQKTHIQNYPFLAAILARTYHYGSGVILNKYWILTTSYAPSGEKPSEVLIRTGSDSAVDKGQTRWASKIIIHPQRKKWANDIALIKLKTPLKYSKSVKEVKFATSEPDKGSKAEIPGFGYANDTSSYDKQKNDIPYTRDGRLRVATVDFFRYERCNQFYDHTKYGQDFTNTSFCTHASEYGPRCYDYGSPLLVEGKMVGLFSGTPDCKSSFFPAVYTNVIPFKQWIDETIRNNTNSREIRQIQGVQY